MQEGQEVGGEPSPVMPGGWGLDAVRHPDDRTELGAARSSHLSCPVLLTAAHEALHQLQVSDGLMSSAAMVVMAATHASG